ncbi:hypothetical protein [Lactiplantibacillus modestisalitolerans]|uniref:Integral membrane protein n=1 Tax=Lactiplantibacillus modestisalitolerans TaxID=1457219 RepID=A0ABV5WS41_9LACO|nr:hypothetical protein [Lactiplantibacillus modestisalitolerans]
MQTAQPSFRRYLIGWALVLTMVASATWLGDVEVILPEIGALTAGTWVYRKADWIAQPAKLFWAPSGTAVIGFLINRLPINYPLKVILGLLLMLVLLKQLRSNLAPSFATGLLPIIINATHWSFIIAIFFWTLTLMVGVRWQKARVTAPVQTVEPAAIHGWQMLGFTVLALGWVGAVWLAGQPQMAGIPPVIVVFFEALQNPNYNHRVAWRQWVALVGAASIGVVSYLLLGAWLPAAVVSLPLVYGLLRGLKLQLPAAFAFPLLALVLPQRMFTTLPLAAALAAGFFLGSLVLYREVLPLLYARLVSD